MKKHSVLSTPTCKSCGQHFEVKKQDSYQTDQYGISLTLVNAVTITGCKCEDKQEVSIPNISGMIATAALKRISDSRKLSGKEVMFLRKAAGCSAKEIAGYMDVTPETFSRWENDKAPIKATHEKFLRLFVMALLKESAPLLKVSERDIAMMNIAGFGESGKTIPIALELIRYKDGQKDIQEEYDTSDMAA